MGFCSHYCKVGIDSGRIYYFKGFRSFIYEHISLKIGLFSTTILGNNKTIPPNFDVLFSLGINEGYVKLVPKLCDLKCKWA